MRRGEDLRPWYSQDEGRFLIVMPCGFTRQGMGVSGTDAQRPWSAPAGRRFSPDVAGAPESGVEPPQSRVAVAAVADPPSAGPAAWDWLSATYPAIAAHLAPFAESARKRTDQGEFWWELRPCAYYPAFDEPKILCPDIAKLPRFSWDTEGAYVNNTGYLLPDELWLLPVLSSRLLWFVLSQIATPL
jgi:hypothetical protein